MESENGYDGHQEENSHRIDTNGYKNFNIYDQDSHFDQTDNYYVPTTSEKNVENENIMNNFAKLDAFENYSTEEEFKSGINNENYVSDEDSNELMKSDEEQQNEDDSKNSLDYQTNNTNGLETDFSEPFLHEKVQMDQLRKE